MNFPFKVFVLAAVVSLTGQLSVAPKAHAGGAHFTCSDYATTPKVVSTLSDNLINLTQGDTLTQSGSDGVSVRLADGPGGWSSLITSFVAPTTDLYVVFNKGNPATVSCRAASAENVDRAKLEVEKREQLGNFLTNLGKVTNGASFTKFSNNAVSSRFGGSTSNFIEGNSFGFSLHSLAAVAQKSALMGQEDATEYGLPLDAAELASRQFSLDTKWNVWVNGTYDRYEGNSNSFDANVGTIGVGADYLLKDGLLIGVLGRYAKAKATITNSGTAKNSAFGGGVYFGAELGGTIVADGYLAYSKSDNSIVTSTATGSFDGSDISAGINIAGTMAMESVTIEPHVALNLGWSKFGAYTDSTGTAVGSQSSNSGTVSFGPKIYFDQVGGDKVRPWVAADYDYAFSNDSTTSANQVIKNNFGSGRLSAGINTNIGAGVLELTGNLGGIGSGQYTSYGGAAKFRLSF